MMHLRLLRGDGDSDSPNFRCFSPRLVARPLPHTGPTAVLANESEQEIRSVDFVADSSLKSRHQVKSSQSTLEGFGSHHF